MNSDTKLIALYFACCTLLSLISFWPMFFKKYNLHANAIWLIFSFNYPFVVDCKCRLYGRLAKTSFISLIIIFVDTQSWKNQAQFRLFIHIFKCMLKQNFNGNIFDISVKNAALVLKLVKYIRYIHSFLYFIDISDNCTIHYRYKRYKTLLYYPLHSTIK